MIKITDRDLEIISSHAKREFANRPSFYGMDNAQIQAWCILSALEGFIVSKGQVPGFTVSPYVQEDSDSINEDGQG